MSCMLRKNDCVPAGTFAHVMAGDSPSPVATPGAAWLYFTGTSPPSGNPSTVMVITGAAAAAGAAPRCCAAVGIAASNAMDEATNQVRVCILLLLISCSFTGSQRGDGNAPDVRSATSELHRANRAPMIRHQERSL